MLECSTRVRSLKFQPKLLLWFSYTRSTIWNFLLFWFVVMANYNLHETKETIPRVILNHNIFELHVVVMGKE